MVTNVWARSYRCDNQKPRSQPLFAYLGAFLCGSHLPNLTSSAAQEQLSGAPRHCLSKSEAFCPRTRGPRALWRSRRHLLHLPGFLLNYHQTFRDLQLPRCFHPLWIDFCLLRHPGCVRFSFMLAALIVTSFVQRHPLLRLPRCRVC